MKSDDLQDSNHPTLLLHVSDLHFNRVERTVVEKVGRLVDTLKPDLVICSGDVTMRARTKEFESARRFLDSLSCPWTCVPGNHDIPLWNVFRRSVRPLARYRKYITADTMPVSEGSNYVAIGLNTARRGHLTTLDWSRGRVNRAQLDKLSKALRNIDPAKHRIVFAHHPFALPPGTEHRGIISRFSTALKRFQEESIDLVLAGHLHRPHVELLKRAPAVEKIQKPNKPIIAVQASTTTSLRLKGAPNSLNAIQLTESKIRILRYEWQEGDFQLSAIESFGR